MTEINPKNERIKRHFFIWQAEANGRSISTVDNYRSALARFEMYTRYADLKGFNKDLAIGFKQHLLSGKSNSTGEVLGFSTISSILRCLKDFFAWLAMRPGYRSIRMSDISYLNLTDKDERKARAKRLRPVPTIEQIRSVVMSLPKATPLQRRDRAMIAFVLLTGIRDGAIPSLRLKHVRIEESLVEQVSSEVETKFSKTIHTYFFPVGDDIRLEVVHYYKYLREELLFGDDDPLFPRTQMAFDANGCFVPIGLTKVKWASSGPIRKVFKDAFLTCGLPSFNPHSFRKTLARLGQKLSISREQYRAWSQNLGHERESTTDNSYGTIDSYTQGEILKELWNVRASGVVPSGPDQVLLNRIFSLTSELQKRIQNTKSEGANDGTINDNSSGV